MQRDRWRFGPFVREAVRNVFDVRAKLFPALVLAVLAGSGLATISAIEASGLQAQLADLQLDGRLVYNYTRRTPRFRSISTANHARHSRCRKVSNGPGSSSILDSSTSLGSGPGSWSRGPRPHSSPT